MPRRSGPRLLAAALVTVLAGAALATAPLSGAGATGDGNPVIVRPSGTKPVYEGFTGPYVVDFGGAPVGVYSYRVERTPPDKEPVVVDQGSFDWTGNGAESRSFSLAALAPNPYYQFVIKDDATAGHRSAVSFEVRAGDQPRCSVLTPSRLRVNTAEEVVYGRLSASCSAPQVTYASWDVKHLSRGTYVNSLVYPGTTKDFWKYFDREALGVYVAKPVSAFNDAADDILQNTPRTVVRLDSRFSFSARRSGQYVTLITSLRKYSRSANTFGPWGKRAVALSYRTCPTCAWTHFATRTTTSSGAATYRFRAPTVREYRVTSGGTTSIWAPYPHYEKR